MSVSVPGGMTNTNGPLQSRLGRQQQEYFISKVREYHGAAAASEAKRLNRTGLLQRQEEVRNYLKLMFGPWPATVALNAVVAGSFNRSGYSVERVRFQSFANFWVTGNLYLPTGASSSNKVPGVVELCGHDSVGKANASYQSAAIGLALEGFACLVIDCVGQGERKMIPSTAPEEHRTLGQQMPLVGWNLAGLQTWDAMRAVDYLVSRPELDTNHIGAFGQSGGGTQAIWLLANDSRITMAAVSCSHSTLQAIMEDELWADHEQTPPNIFKYGIDFDDILASFAPKPLLIIGQELDYFDSRGVREVHKRVLNFYTRLNAASEVRLYMGSGSHGLTAASRGQMYQWFNRAVTGDDSPVTEPAITPEAEATLLVTASGNVSEIASSISAANLLTSFADTAVAARGTYNVDELKKRVKDTLGINWPQAGVPHYRNWAGYPSWTNSGITIDPAITPPNYPKTGSQVYAVEVEDNILIPLYHNANATFEGYPLQAVAANTRCLLYIPHSSADQELSQPGRTALVNTIVAAEPTAPLFAMELRGYGELKPHLNLSAYAENFHAQAAEMLGEPMLGKMVTDILRCVDLLASYGYIVRIAGTGYGSIPAALAGLLHPSIVQVTLVNSLTRWYACAKAQPDEMAWPQALLPRGVLAKFDLPDVYASLPNLSNTSQWGAWGGLGGET